PATITRPSHPEQPTTPVQSRCPLSPPPTEPFEPASQRLRNSTPDSPSPRKLQGSKKREREAQVSEDETDDDEEEFIPRRSSRLGTKTSPGTFAGLDTPRKTRRKASPVSDFD